MWWIVPRGPTFTRMNVPLSYIRSTVERHYLTFLTDCSTVTLSKGNTVDWEVKYPLNRTARSVDLLFPRRCIVRRSKHESTSRFITEYFQENFPINLEISITDVSFRRRWYVHLWIEFCFPLPSAKFLSIGYFGSNERIRNEMSIIPCTNVSRHLLFTERNWTEFREKITLSANDSTTTESHRRVCEGVIFARCTI